MNGYGITVLDVPADRGPNLDGLLQNIMVELTDREIVKPPQYEPHTLDGWLKNRIADSQARILFVVRNVDCSVYAAETPEQKFSLLSSLCSLNAPIVFTSIRPIRPWALDEGWGSVRALTDVSAKESLDDWDGYSRALVQNSQELERLRAESRGSPRLLRALVLEEDVGLTRKEIANDFWRRLKSHQEALALVGRDELDALDRSSREILVWSGVLIEESGDLVVNDPELAAVWTELEQINRDS